MNNEIAIIYADKDLLVVNKPPKLLSVPGRGEHKQDCLVHRLQTDFAGARIVHRLDYDTSGLMVLAMHAEAHRRLSMFFETRQVDKSYVARIQGQLPSRQGGIDLPLALDWHNRPLHKVDFIYGKPSQTGWQVLDSDATTSLVRLYPFTGRSHQLRVHMLAMNCPMIGDPLYHPQGEQAPRLCLHAQTLSFRHPHQGHWLEFKLDIPF
jgi:tRNA pseudouridine32 synthase/23S rRNA pseudouridine746 synthase